MEVIYGKYMQEVWDMKAKVYNDYKNSGKASYIEFLKEELKNVKVLYRKQDKEKTGV